MSISESSNRNPDELMTKIEMIEWLEGMWVNSPDPCSGEESYRHLKQHVDLILPNHREALVDALRIWLSLGESPKTMVAADLAADFHLTELRHDLFCLLEDVKGGRTKLHSGLKAHYQNLISGCLSRI